MKINQIYSAPFDAPVFKVRAVILVTFTIKPRKIITKQMGGERIYIFFSEILFDPSYMKQKIMLLVTEH